MQLRISTKGSTKMETVKKKTSQLWIWEVSYDYSVPQTKASSESIGPLKGNKLNFNPVHFFSTTGYSF